MTHAGSPERACKRCFVRPKGFGNTAQGCGRVTGRHRVNPKGVALCVTAP